MSLYEMRTYTLHPGKMPEATKHYHEVGWPVLQRGGFDSRARPAYTLDKERDSTIARACRVLLVGIDAR